MGIIYITKTMIQKNVFTKNYFCFSFVDRAYVLNPIAYLNVCPEGSKWE
jgi:hypothetical protein